MHYPDWLKPKTPKALQDKRIRQILADDSVHTVCESALCPNRGECFSKNTVTFMILGDFCSRCCKFCAVKKGRPLAIDPEEPGKIAVLAAKLQLEHVVITSVTRDDLSDGGAEQFQKTILAVKGKRPAATVEVLVPDFQGNTYSLDLVLAAQPAVFNHNVETVPRLYADIRPQADFRQSLAVLAYARQNFSGLVKSGLMVGLGEMEAEIKAVLEELKNIGVDIVTIGQYLAPSKAHAPVLEFIHPEKFAEYKIYGEKKLGLRYVFAGPLVRSSYLAGEVLTEIKTKRITT